MSRSIRKSCKGFTLVELLVVIGIIAVLVGILLPSLNKARRSAKAIQCSSNMRQIAAAMLMYANGNKGNLPATQFGVIAGLNPTGWWWPNELVRGKYINAPSVYRNPGSSTAQKRFDSSSVFKCPEGVDESDALGSPGGNGDFPTDTLNNTGVIGNDGQCATDGFGIVSWYMLVSRVQTGMAATGVTGNNGYPAGLKMTPFVEFSSAATIDDINFAANRRTMGMIKKSSEMVMVVEAANNNWVDQTASMSQPPLYLKRMGARHGKKTGDGRNAFTNLAFFDGHVSMFPTEPFTRLAPAGIPGKSSTDNNLVSYTQETIFFVNRQRGLN